LSHVFDDGEDYAGSSDNDGDGGGGDSNDDGVSAAAGGDSDDGSGSDGNTDDDSARLDTKTMKRQNFNKFSSQTLPGIYS
jgi:hypothetical protein